jgi:hypothetical protein
MNEKEDTSENRLSDKLSKDSINRNVLASLLRGDSQEQLAGALYITSTLLNEAMSLLSKSIDKVNLENEHARKYQYLFEATEQHRQRGKKVLDSAKKGHESIYGTSEEKQKVKTDLIRHCYQIAKNNPNWKLTAIQQQAAEDNKISLRTVQRRIPNLKDLLGR